MPGSSVAGDNRSNNDQDHSEDDVKSPAGAGSVLSERASTAIEHRLYGCIRDNLGRCWMNPYCAKTNPKGIIDMAVSENRLMHDELLQKFSDPNFLTYEKFMLAYNDSRGIPVLRKAIAEFLTERGNAPQPLDPDQIVIINGSTTCIDALAFCIGDPNDAFLSPTPYYGMAARDAALRSQMTFYPVHLSSKPREGETRPFELTVERLEEALTKAHDENVRIRGLFLMNPHNPLGDVYSKELVMDMLRFCKRHKLHVVLDEVYLTSIFEESVSHTSILRLKTEDIPDPERTHFIWAFSKDFGLSGMRIGMIYTWSKELLSILNGGMADLTQTPACVQQMMANLLLDKVFLDTVYFPLNLQRLRDTHKIVTDKLTELEIPFLRRPAGLYIWADFSKYLEEITFEAEGALMERFMDYGVALQPSRQFFAHETNAGWFRIIFSNQPDVVKLAMERIDEAIKHTITKRRCEDKV